MPEEKYEQMCAEIRQYMDEKAGYVNREARVRRAQVGYGGDHMPVSSVTSKVFVCYLA